jgi:hypothetical protein
MAQGVEYPPSKHKTEFKNNQYQQEKSEKLTYRNGGKKSANNTSDKALVSRICKRFI